MNEIILASQSPYRKELLLKLGIPFKTHAPEIDEKALMKQTLSSEKIAAELALKKALKIQSLYPSSLIIGSDQILCFDHKIFGKPENKKNAISQLKMLRGKSHSLITAVSVLYKDKAEHFLNITKLTIRNDLTDTEIERYVEIENPINCAGSYKIEGLGISLFKDMKTEDFTAIVGLPLIKLADILRKFGHKVP